MTDHPTSVTAASGVMQAHIDALNARDAHALARTLHFPHYRLSGAQLKVWDTPDTYFEDFQDRAGSDWARSAFEDIKVLQSAPEKVRLDARIDRFDREGNIITTFRSLWVITCEQGRWAAKFRSSFAQR